jgi:hypothetical protein
MGDVIEIFGNCAATNCKRDSPIITSKDDMEIVNGKQYHKSCKPAEAEQEAENRSYT